MGIKVNRLETDDYYDKDLYLVECTDEDTFDEVRLTDDIKIKIDKRYAENNLHKHPVKGKVIHANDDSEFKVGENLICKFWAFRNADTEEYQDHIVKDGKKLFFIRLSDIVCSVDNKGQLRPRKGTIICQPIYGKLMHSSLYLTSNNEGRRRDIVKVINPCPDTKVKKGDYLLTQLGGDYEFYNGRELLISVDEYFDDYYAIVDSEHWYDGGDIRRSVNLNEQISF